ncbi:MAG: hypothetical protein K8F25_00980 [Fimbriimonadaceae bacterium]|nr:hypothetical protein [Alphaproteobacteria bacterium]
MAERFKNTIVMLLLVNAVLLLHAQRTVRAGTMPDFYCDGGEVTINISHLSQDNVYIWMDFDRHDGELLTSATAGFTGSGSSIAADLSAISGAGSCARTNST